VVSMAAEAMKITLARGAPVQSAILFGRDT
jgi:hypothetical protein